MTGTPAGDSLLHQHLDEYRLEALLGQGGMARVYRAVDERLQRPVAIKVIDAPFRADPDYITRFEREARAIAQLKHPHIVGVYRFGKADDLLYLAMEYIAGTNLAATLADYRRDERLIPQADILPIVRPICMALDYAHAQGVIHRDVTPANILLATDGRPILSDFGLALLDNQTRGEIFGTPHYMAPEQVVSSANAVPQSDLYSIGVILYQILTGHLPFDAPHLHDVATLHLTEPPPPPRQHNPALSPQLEAVLLKALAKAPNERFATGAALAEALAKAIQPAANTEPANTDDPRSVAATVPADAPQPADARRGGTAENRGQVISTRYLLKNIRALLIELTVSLTETQLRQLYLDLPEFKPVHRQLTQSRGKAEIIDRLLEYAEQSMQLTELLALAQETNPALYNKHQPYTESVTLGRRNLVGHSLGQYHLVERLGQGGMADVYKAYQPSLARYVAIKVIHSHLVDHDELLERFEREAIAVANLHHPNIVQVFDFVREDDLYYMVMEYIDGPTLEAELNRYRDGQQLFPLAETLPLFEALAEAIDYAHRQKVIHRDLKPANIMFTPNRRVVLTDFGIARLLNLPGYTATNAVLGTPAYMSPEQAQGGLIDQRSDIFSLGVILYELVTGRLPYEGDNPVAILLELVSQGWPMPTSINPHLPPPVEEVVLTAMQQDPAERYPSAGAMTQALQRAIELAHSQRGVVKRSEAAELAAPEIEVKLPSATTDRTPLPPGMGDMADGRVPLSNSGQVAFGGQNIIQIGTVSGGQISLGMGGSPPPAAPPPRLAELQATVRQLVIDLQARAAETLPPEIRPAAQERLGELSEALTAAPPDLDTAVYVKNWLTKNNPALTAAVTDLLRRPAVSQLMAASGETVAAEFRRRLG